MATEIGLVLKVKNDTIIVKTQRKKMCEHCSSKDECSTMSGSSDDLEVEVKNLLGAKQGDFVKLHIPTSSLLILSFLMYMVPVIFLIFGGFIGLELANFLYLDENISSIIFSLTFFIITILIIRYYSNLLAQNKKFTPRLHSIIKNRKIPVH